MAKKKESEFCNPLVKKAKRKYSIEYKAFGASDKHWKKYYRKYRSEKAAIEAAERLTRQEEILHNPWKYSVRHRRNIYRFAK